MQRFKRNSLFIPLMLLYIGMVPVHAQSVLSAATPFGLSQQPASGTNFGMGGIAIAVPDEQLLQLGNPANLATVERIAFSTLILNEYLRIEDQGHASRHLLIYPVQISLAVALKQYGTIGFSASKKTDVTLKFNTSNNFNGIPFSKVWDRSGGINAWELGWGYPIKKWLYAGATYERLYLSIKDTKIQMFDTIMRYDSTSLTLRGNGIRIGAMMLFNTVTAGITGEYILKDNARFTKGYYLGNASLINPAAIRSGEIPLQLPPSLGIGASWKYMDKLLVGAEMRDIVWSYFSHHSATNSAIPYNNLRDHALSFSSGATYIPAPHLLIPRYWETIRYRAGIRLAQLPLQRSTEIAVSLGSGFPLKASGFLDIGIEIGQRSSAYFKGYTERFFQIAIGIDGGRNMNKPSTVLY